MSRIVVECPDCNAIDLTTHLDHDSSEVQFQGVKDAHWLLVTQHNDETGHRGTMQVITDEQ